MKRTTTPRIGNVNRGMILTTLQAHPGSTFRELMRLTGITNGTLRHHLNVLLHNAVITEQRHGVALHHWMGEPDMRDTLRATERAVFAAITGRQRQKEILAKVPLAKSTTQWALRQLQDKGLVHVQLTPRSKWYTKAVA